MDNKIEKKRHPAPIKTDIYGEDKKLMNIISDIERYSLYSTFRNPVCIEHYYTLINCYSDFSIIDLLNLIKIDRLYESGYISDEIRRDLKKLYIIRLEAICEVDSNLDEIDKIDKELSEYNISPYMTIKELLDDSVYNNGISRDINFEGTKKLVKKLSNEQKS